MLQPRLGVPKNYISWCHCLTVVNMGPGETLLVVIASLLQYICVCVMPDQMMSFGGSQDPCALMHVMSIGNLGVEENKRISDALFKFVKEKLKIEGNR